MCDFAYHFAINKVSFYRIIYMIADDSVSSVVMILLKFSVLMLKKDVIVFLSVVLHKLL
jgi:hypothetical protein